MADALDIILKRVNDVGKKISEKANIYLKKAAYKGEEYTGRGLQQIENEKLKWKLKKTYIDLGKYIHASSKNNIVDYSDDEKFILLLDKINRIEKNINKKK